MLLLRERHPQTFSSDHLVPRAARTSPSKDSTDLNNSHSYLEHLDFNWPKDIQIRTDLIGCKETQVRKVYRRECLSATRSKDSQNGTPDRTLVALVECDMKILQGVCLRQLL